MKWAGHACNGLATANTHPIIFAPSSLPGPSTVTTADKIRFRSSGKPLEGVEICISNPDEEGIGEVRHVHTCV